MRTTDKGQATIFILLGLALLAIVGVALWLMMGDRETAPPELLTPTELLPVRAAFESCLADVGREALERVGESGGYTQPDRFAYSLLPTESEGFDFTPQRLPYWHYLDGCEENAIGCFDSHKPALCYAASGCPQGFATGRPSIQGELERYMIEHGGACLAALEPLQGQFEITPISSTPQARVRIGEDETEFTLVYPLRVSLVGDDVQATINEFSATHRLTLPDIYRFATQIYEDEAQAAFVEELVMDLVSIYSGIESPLPPTRGVYLTSEMRGWVQSDVRRILSEDLLPYLNAVQIVNALESYRFVETPEYEREYSEYGEATFDRLSIKAGSGVYLLGASIIYPYPRIHLDMGDSELLRPKAIDFDTPFLELLGIGNFRDYNFKYDISFPYLVRIEDPYAFSGEGYAFTFAMEANVRNNRPVTPERIRYDLRIGAEPHWDDPHLLLDREFTLITRDRLTGEPLPGVSLEYECGLTSSRGETQIVDGVAQRTTKLPACLKGGVLRLSKPGYQGVGLALNNERAGPPERFSFSLWPIKQLPLTVAKRTEQNVSSIVEGGAGSIGLYDTVFEDLAINESAMVTIERYREDPLEEEMPQIKSFVYTPHDISVEPVAIDAQMIEEYYRDDQINRSQRDLMLRILEEAAIDEQNRTLESINLSVGLVPGRYRVDVYAIDFTPFELGNETLSFDDEDDYLDTLKGGAAAHGGPMALNWLLTGAFSPLGPIISVVGGLLTDLLGFGDIEIDFDEQRFTSWVIGGAKSINLTLDTTLYEADGIRFFAFTQDPPERWDDIVHDYASIEQLQNNTEYLAEPRLIIE